MNSTNNLWIMYKTLKCYCNSWEQYYNVTNNSKEVIEWSCKQDRCKHEWKASPVEIVDNPWCPKCDIAMVEPIPAASIKKRVYKIIKETGDYREFNEVMKKVWKGNRDKGLAQEFFCQIYFISHTAHFNVKKYYARCDTDEIPDHLRNIVNLKDWGSDGIIEHTDGKISLVQVKFRSSVDRVLTRDSIGKMGLEFASIGDDIRGNMYLFSNTCECPKNITVNEEKNIKTIMYGDLRECVWELVQSVELEHLEVGSGTYRVEFPLREWQKEALEFTAGSFGRKTVVAACGAGKTFFAHSVSQRFPTALIVVPTLHLLSQTFENFAAWNPMRTFCLVGSDLSTDEIVNVPYSLTTDCAVIADHLVDGVIIIATYQSLNRVIEAIDKRPFRFALSIFDEAHICCGKTKGNYSLATSVGFPTDNRLFITATPKIYVANDNTKARSMDDEKIFGEQWVYSFNRAIDEGVLSNYSIVIGCGVFDASDHKLDMEFSANFLTRALHRERINSVMVCGTSHQNSKKFYSKMAAKLKGSDYELFLMPKNATSKHKSEAVRLVESGKKCIIFQVRVLSIGSDMPSLESVMLLGKRRSVIDIVQSVSRCLRISPSKSMAHILVPCIVEDPSDMNSQGTFPGLRSLLSALGSVDDALYESVTLRCAHPKNNSVQLSRAIKFDMVEYEDSRVSLADFELVFFNRLGSSQCFSAGKKFKLLMEYISKNGKKLPDRSVDVIGQFTNHLLNALRGTTNCYKDYRDEWSRQIREALPEGVWDAKLEISEEKKVSRRITSVERFEMLMEYISEHNKLPSDKVKVIGPFTTNLLVALRGTKNHYKDYRDEWSRQIRKALPDGVWDKRLKNTQGKKSA